MADRFYNLNHTEVINPAPNMAANEKISIYAKGYLLRLMECMAAEYPVLLHLLGAELFNTFTKAYLAEMPPASPDLYDLGLNFAAFLKASQPKNNVDAASTLFDLPVELARLERAMAEVWRRQGLENTTTLETSDNNPVFYLFDASAFKTSPCLVLLQLQFLLTEFVRAVQRGEDAPTPPLKQTYTAVSRTNYVVQINDLEAWQWYFLKALQNGADYVTTINQTAQSCAINTDTLMADLMLWIPLAIKTGYIYRPEA